MMQLVIAGPPCQEFSNSRARSRAAKGGFKGGRAGQNYARGRRARLRQQPRRCARKPGHGERALWERSARARSVAEAGPGARACREDRDVSEASSGRKGRALGLAMVQRRHGACRFIASYVPEVLNLAFLSRTAFEASRSRF